MSRTIRAALRRAADYDVSLTTVDIGASVEPYHCFSPLLPYCTYIGFDPDLRAVKIHTNPEFHNYVMIDKAVVPDDRDEVEFHLTRNPTCSSTLSPNPDNVGKYYFDYRFEVVSDVRVAATTLNQVAETYGLRSFDWIKLDTQGIDLRLINSLSPDLEDRLLVVDVEPGYDEYYRDEDTFCRLHQEMTRKGYWLADLEYTSASRVRRATVDKHLKPRNRLESYVYEFALKKSPVAANARYIRDVDRLLDKRIGKSTLLKLWLCAVCSGNHPYALEIIERCSEAGEFGEDLRQLLEFTIKLNRRSLVGNGMELLRRIKPRNIKALLRNGR